jgi:hypothetical protein
LLYFQKREIALKKIYKKRGNKKEQVLGTSKKEKVRREVKMDKCPTVELGVQYPPERKKIEHLIPLKSFKKQERYVFPQKEH